jgi:hypothetical protein
MARCFQDSCSTTVTVVEIDDVGPGYQIDVNLDADGGLECGVDPNAGLRVRLSGDAGNIISRDVDDGGLYASIPNAIQTTQDPAQHARVAVPIGADSAAPATAALALSYTNATAVEQLLILTGQFRYDYEVLGTNSAAPDDPDRVRTGTVASGASAAGGGGALALTPFNAQCIARLLAAVPTVDLGAGVGVAAALVADHFSTSGMIYIPNPGPNDQKSEWRPFALPFQLGAGLTINLTADFYYEGPNPAADVNPRKGFAVANAKIVAIPLAVT